jgi:hypothetical protein
MNYSVSDKNEIIIADDNPIEVTKSIEYNPVANADDCQPCSNQDTKGGEERMDKTSLVNEIIACQNSQWSEDDRETLMALEEGVLRKMQFNAPAPPPVEEPADNQDVSDAEPEQVDNEAKSVDEYLANAPAKIKDTIESAMQLHEQRRGALVEKIMGAEGNKFKRDVLANKSMDDLEGIAALIRDIEPVDNEDDGAFYVGNAGVPGPVDNADDDEPLPVPSINDMFPAVSGK